MVLYVYYVNFFFFIPDLTKADIFFSVRTKLEFALDITSKQFYDMQ